MQFSPFSSNSYSSNIKSVVRFSVVFFSLCALWGCDKLAHYQPPKTTETKTEQTQSQLQQLVRGIYSSLSFDLYHVDNTDKEAFIRDLLEGLTIYDSQGNVIAGVAQNWQTKDNKTWQFHLRPDAKWNNGDAVIAQDFVRSWQTLAQTNAALKQYLVFMNLANAQAVIDGQLSIAKLGIHALNDTTVEIQLEKATPYLPKMLAHIALLPTKIGADNEFLSNGAYVFEMQQANKIWLKKNPNYWAQNQVEFDHVLYDQLAQNQPLKKSDLVLNPPQQTEANQQLPTLCTYFYEFNFNDPILRQSAVRKALVSMISSQGIVHNERLAMTPINEYLPRHFQLEDKSEWQASLVEQLLQQAGISETKPLHLRITYDNTGIHPNIANRIARAWGQSDLIHVTLDLVTWQQLQQKRQKGDFQVIRSGWCADYNDPSAFFQILYSHHPDNKMGFKNEKVDQLLMKTLKAKTATELTALYQQAQYIIKKERVFLPIFQYNQGAYVAPSLMGIDNQNPTGVIYSKDLKRRVQANSN